MTRRNEIIEEAEKHMYDWGVDVDRFDVPDIFAKGAEWADKTMIEKVCSYLYAKTKMSSTEINAFRKAMEE